MDGKDYMHGVISTYVVYIFAVVVCIVGLLYCIISQLIEEYKERKDGRKEN